MKRWSLYSVLMITILSVACASQKTLSGGFPRMQLLQIEGVQIAENNEVVIQYVVDNSTERDLCLKKTIFSKKPSSYIALRVKDKWHRLVKESKGYPAPERLDVLLLTAKSRMRGEYSFFNSAWRDVKSNRFPLMGQLIISGNYCSGNSNSIVQPDFLLVSEWFALDLTAGL